MLKNLSSSFEPLLKKVMPGFIGCVIGIALLYLIFSLIIAYKGERLGIVVRTLIAVIAFIVLAYITTLAFSFITTICAVIIAIWLFCSNN